MKHSHVCIVGRAHLHYIQHCLNHTQLRQGLHSLTRPHSSASGPLSGANWVNYYFPPRNLETLQICIIISEVTVYAPADASGDDDFRGRFPGMIRGDGPW